MKTALNFQSESEFQNFFGQLSAAEFPYFQAVEGSGGDKGFDGINETTSFQAYYANPKNRDAAHYKSKIDHDIQKVIENRDKLGFIINEWVLVVPEDLSIEIVSHLAKKSQETGLKCHYWGATKLTQLVTKHPHIQDSFPTIFLPPVRVGIAEIKQTLGVQARPRVLDSVEILTDSDFENLKAEISEGYRSKSRAFAMQFGDSSAPLVADEAYRKEASKKTAELMRKKQASDTAFKLEIEDENDRYVLEIEIINDSMNRRGLFNSGIRDKELHRALTQHLRTGQRICLKYGKTFPPSEFRYLE